MNEKTKKAKKAKKVEEIIVLKDGPDNPNALMVSPLRLLEMSTDIAIAAIPNFPQRNPERVSEFAVETAKQILERCEIVSE